MELSQFKNIHFVGIGGISMSGLAILLKSKGHKVSGSDLKASNLTEKLIGHGITVHIGHQPENIAGSDLIVYTAAVKQDNPELVRAKELGIPIIDRATLLGEIMLNYPRSIAVAGSHGKTTTTSLISVVLTRAGLDPTVLVGGEVDILGGNVRVGNSPYMVAESCEYQDSFLKFHPYIGVVLNIEWDHVDYFKHIESIIHSFIEFAKLLPPDGYLVVCGDNAASTLLSYVNCNTLTFGLQSKNDWKADNISFDESGCSSFDVIYKDERIGHMKLSIPGEHNIYNALAATAVCFAVGVPIEVIEANIDEFTGTHRRFEVKGRVDGATVIDDYGHHPSEIKATLKTAKNYPHNRIWCIFQPHTYTRTYALLNEFAESFYDADYVIVTDIYAAREKDNGLVKPQDLVERLAANGVDALYMKEFEDIASYLLDNIKEGDLVITQGAGDITKLGDMLLNKKGASYNIHNSSKSYGPVV